MSTTKNIAILSPSLRAYSETFIEAHKNMLDGNIFYYYGGLYECQIEGKGNLKSSSKKYLYQLKRKLFKKSFSWVEERFVLDSFKKNRIDVVLAEYGPTAQQFLPVVKELNLPLIVHFHGFDASMYGVIKANKNYRQVFRYAQYVIVVSKKMKNDLLKLGCPPNKLIYNVCGPHPEFFKVKPVFLQEQFIAIGRFVDKKAPYYCILAFKKVVQIFPNAILVMAGDGPLLSTCKNLVKFFEIEDKVQFPGIINRDQFKEFLRDSIALVQHSVTAENGDAEGTPVAVLEAGAAGLPVVATFHAGIPDIITDELTGLLVEEHDVEGMGGKMLQLLRDKELARSLGENSRKNIQKKFTLEKSISALNQIVQRVQEEKNFHN